MHYIKQIDDLLIRCWTNGEWGKFVSLWLLGTVVIALVSFALISVPALAWTGFEPYYERVFGTIGHYANRPDPTMSAQIMADVKVGVMEGLINGAILLFLMPVMFLVQSLLGDFLPRATAPAAAPHGQLLGD